MLVSHKKQFIFIKTRKTAGTSVESYFKPYCMPDGECEQSFSCFEYISEAGIVGFRSKGYRKGNFELKRPIFHTHMPAPEIRDLLGQNIWNHYFKFTVIRNPYDKMVSGFYFRKKQKENHNYFQKTKALIGNLLDIGSPISRIKGDTEVEQFRSWVKKGGKIIDQDNFLIDGKECVDFFIRFENLYEDIGYVCDRLSIPYEPSRIPMCKKGIRNNRIPVRDYYDKETKELVQKIYAWEIDRFGYKMPSDR